jgi:hypothetical protein
MARAALANVWQYFNFSRPTSDYDRFSRLGSARVSFGSERQDDKPPRRRGPQEYRPEEEDSGFSRSIPPDMDLQWRKIHPIVLIGYCRRIVDRVCLRKRCAGPKSMATSRGDCDCGKEVYFRRHE